MMKATRQLLKWFLVGFNLMPVFIEEEFRHWFTPQDDITFIIEDPITSKITNMVNYYTRYIFDIFIIINDMKL